MHREHEGDPRDPRVPSLEEILDRFPGPVAVAADPVGQLPPASAFEAHGDEPWAITVDYADPDVHLLTVRTVRSPRGLDPRGLPREDLASMVANFPGVTTSTPPRPGDEDSWVADLVARHRQARAAIADRPVTTASVPIDGTEVDGRRIDFADCAAVELAWGEQTVFCAGRPEIIGRLRLATMRRGPVASRP
jgi:hypothetical protein